MLNDFPVTVLHNLPSSRWKGCRCIFNKCGGLNGFCYTNRRMLQDSGHLHPSPLKERISSLPLLSVTDWPAEFISPCSLGAEDKFYFVTLEFLYLETLCIYSFSYTFFFTITLSSGFCFHSPSQAFHPFIVTHMVNKSWEADLCVSASYVFCQCLWHVTVKTVHHCHHLCPRLVCERD